LALRKRGVRLSPWVLHFNAGACNGCDIEFLAAVSPRYDPERMGVRLAPTPRHADVLVVTGALNKKSAERLVRLYEQMPFPKYVVAVGACAATGGVFSGSYSLKQSGELPFKYDVVVPGCPPKPEAILCGLKALLDRIGR